MPELTRPDKIADEIYEAAQRDRLQDKPRRYLGMSQIGAPCARSLWYQFRQFTPLTPEGRMVMIWALGDAIEAEIIRWLILAGYKINGINRQVATILEAQNIDRGLIHDNFGEVGQQTFSDHNNWFGGHCDGTIYGVTQRTHILECKSAKDRKFKQIKAQGIRKANSQYYCQGQLYMGYSGLERILWVIYNKDTSEIYTERGYFNQSDYLALRDRTYSIITANEPPAKGFKQESFECQWCDYRTLCWYPQEHHQRWLTCGSCAWCRFTHTVAHCVSGSGGEIPRDFWGKECSSWKPNENILMPF